MPKEPKKYAYVVVRNMDARKLGIRGLERLMRGERLCLSAAYAERINQLAAGSSMTAGEGVYRLATKYDADCR